MNSSVTQQQVIIGIGWADQTHAWHVQTAESQSAGILQQDAPEIQQWIKHLQQQYSGGQFAIVAAAVPASMKALQP